jgi:hypothetical protein
MKNFFWLNGVVFIKHLGMIRLPGGVSRIDNFADRLYRKCLSED